MAQTTTIEGTVRGNGTLLAGVRIDAFPADDPDAQRDDTAVTDANGVYVLDELDSATTYKLRANYEGDVGDYGVGGTTASRRVALLTPWT